MRTHSLGFKNVNFGSLFDELGMRICCDGPSEPPIAAKSVAGHTEHDTTQPDCMCMIVVCGQLLLVLSFGVYFSYVRILIIWKPTKWLRKLWLTEKQISN